MILIKMEKLSESELRNIAEQEFISDWQVLSREELIQALTDKYEEEDDNFSTEDSRENQNFRYLTGLTDYKDISETVEGLPGVEELPLLYPDTNIHLLFKNTNWGYAFWSISNLDQEQLAEKNAEVVLFVTITDVDGKKDQYDIPISSDDVEWNIGFPSSGGNCTAAIVAIYPNGEREVLAKSNTLSLSSSYWLKHSDEMKENDPLFKLYLSLLTTKEGEIIDNQLVREIVTVFEKEDVNE